MHIIGHRGARGEAPENTLAGFQYLSDLGIQAVEFDVRQLTDTSLVVMHDDNFLRTTGIDQDLYTSTVEQLNTFNQTHIWMDWPAQVTPLLMPCLDIMKHFNHIEVEVKAVSSPEAAERLLDVLERQLQGFEHNATITSFDLQILTALAQRQSPFKRGLLVENATLPDPIQLACDLGCSQIGWMDALATAINIQNTHTAQLAVSVWTVNNIERAKQLSNLGIQGLITDFPKMMRDALS